MATWGRCDFRQLKELQERIQKLEGSDFDAFCEACAKELAARLLAKVIKITPTGDYPSSTGKKGGTLKRGWTAKTEAEASSGGKGNAKDYVAALPITKSGNMIEIEIINPVRYASYVEFGHRTRNHKGWVKGKFMLTISEQELQTQAPNILENKIKKYLGECFNG